MIGKLPFGKAMIVDLDDPQLAKRIEDKRLTFQKVADGMARFNMVSAEVRFSQDAASATARAYWLLNIPFKHQVMGDATNTNEIKRAAIQTCAISAIRPFAPRDPTNIQQMSSLLANPNFAMLCGSSTIGRKLDPTREEQERFPHTFMRLRFPSLDKFVRDVQNDRYPVPLKYNVDLSDQELLSIDAMIYMFESFRRTVP